MLVRVLGSVDVSATDGRVTPIAGERPSLLLALLAEHAPLPLSAGRLTDALWGEDLPVDPAGALQSQMTRLRRRLMDPGAIETGGGGYRLAGAEVDAHLFEERVRSAEGAGDELALERLDAALSLWRGQPFGELANHPYLRAATARLEESRTHAEEARTAVLIDLGRGDEAAAAAAALVAAHPLRERPRTLLARCLAESGRHAEALDVLRAFRRTLADEVGLSPSPAVEELERRILHHDPLGERRPGTPSSASEPRLPEYATSFLGRAGEVAALQALLREHRLVSVVGPGGVGKTRLAVEAARALPAETFPGGRWFVDLTSVRSADTAIEAVAGALGVERQAGTPGASRLADALATRPALLIVDNCEHVLDAVAELVDELVRGTTALVVLATSRERLGLAAERCLLLSPLPPPDGDRISGAAAELFVDRARAVQPGFSPGPADEPALCELCRRLDGLPLGIELAAMALSARTPAEVLDDLAVRAGPAWRRGGDARHRSMDSLVAWSYDLLDGTDRRFFEALCIFAGGFTRDGAAAVAAVDAEEAPLRLGRLVDRSLVAAEHGDRVTRHRLLEPIRAFAEDRLERRGASAPARARHAAWMTEFVRTASDGLSGVDEPSWSAQMFSELGNLRAACRHLLDGGDGDACLQLLAPLYWYVWSGAHSEIATWAQEAVDRFGDGEPSLVADVCAVAANGAWQRGDIGVAEVLARRGVDAVAGDIRRGRRALDAWADVCLLRGDNAKAVRLYRQGLAGARQAVDAKHTVLGSINLALGLGYTGDVDAAIALAEQARELARASGNPSNIAFAEFVRAEIILETSPDEALPLLDTAVSAATIAGNRFIIGVAGLSAVSAAARTGDPHDALRRYEPLLDHWQRVGACTQQWTTVRTLIETLVRADRLEPAAILYGALGATRRAAPLIGSDAVRLDGAERGLRTGLGDARFLQLRGRGAALGDAQAIDLARDAARTGT